MRSLKNCLPTAIKQQKKKKKKKLLSGLFRKSNQVNLSIVIVIVHSRTKFLPAASCPLVEGLYLQEADSMLQLLCVPSQHRTDILAWICSSISPNFANSKVMTMGSKDPDVLTKEMAVFGQKLMLCKAGDLDLIRGDASHRRQLLFLEQLLTLVPGCKKSAGHRVDKEMLLNELYAAENLPHLTQMLKPTLEPWPAHIKYIEFTVTDYPHNQKQVYVK